jgi:hypothetical protein
MAVADVYVVPVAAEQVALGLARNGGSTAVVTPRAGVYQGFADIGLTADGGGGAARTYSLVLRLRTAGGVTIRDTSAATGSLVSAAVGVVRAALGHYISAADVAAHADLELAFVLTLTAGGAGITVDSSTTLVSGTVAG